MNTNERIRRAALIVIAGILVLYLVRIGLGHKGMEGQAAKDFSLPLLNGGTLDLSTHRDKEIVVLDFWASWCPPCRAGLPAIARLAKNYAGKGVAVYAVNREEPADTVREFLAESGIDVNVALDETGEIGDSYGVLSIPRTLIIDRKGIVRADHSGFSNDLEDALARTLDALIPEP